MSKFLSWIKKLFAKTEDPLYNYLSKSTSLADLERRQRIAERQPPQFWI